MVVNNNNEDDEEDVREKNVECDGEVVMNHQNMTKMMCELTVEWDRMVIHQQTRHATNDVEVC